MRLRTCRRLVLIVMALGILLLCFSGTLAEEDAVSSPEITER
jgi:hypothetical protein